jgi:hypothetical protein
LIVFQRLHADKVGLTRANAGATKELGHKESFKAALKDWRTFYFMLLYVLIVGRSVAFAFMM